MKHIYTGFILLSSFTMGCNGMSDHEPSHSASVGGPCEGCEAIHESPVPFDRLPHIDTLPDYSDAGERLFISGTVYESDGRTPARNVILYFYHTDQTGAYPVKGNEKDWSRRHGYIRGWIKTNDKGEYAFYTLRPMPYRDRSSPAHIHITVKEPGLNEYWIDDFVFADDTLLTKEVISAMENRGGSGILKTERQAGVSVAERDITLGRNVPGYSHH